MEDRAFCENNGNRITQKLKYVIQKWLPLSVHRLKIGMGLGNNELKSFLVSGHKFNQLFITYQRNIRTPVKWEYLLGILTQQKDTLTELCLEHVLVSNGDAEEKIPRVQKGLISIQLRERMYRQSPSIVDTLEMPIMSKLRSLTLGFRERIFDFRHGNVISIRECFPNLVHLDLKTAPFSLILAMVQSNRKTAPATSLKVRFWFVIRPMILK